MSGLASEVVIQEEQPKVRQIPTGATLRLFGEGVTVMGPIGEARGPFASEAEWQQVFGGWAVESADSCAAVRGFFDNGGSQLYWTRIVHTTVQGDPTTKTSAAGSSTIQTATAAATAGSITSAVQPYGLADGDDFDVAIDGGGPQTKTISATAASRESASGPFDLENGWTLQIAIDGGSTLTKTFASSEFGNVDAATPAEVVASLNAFFASQNAGAVASVTSTTKVTITSNRKGTGSGVNVVGGTANAAFAFTTGNVAGTGNVSNVAAVTAAELAAVLSTLTGCVVSVVSGAVKITSSTTGPSSSVQVQSSSTGDDETGFDNAIHSGSSGAAVDTLRIDAKWDGAYAGNVRAIVAAATSGEADRFNLYVEVSGVVVERFYNLTMADADARFVETIVNGDGGSIYVSAVDLDATPVDRPADGTYGPLAGGDNGLAGLADSDFTGGETVNGSTGFRCFDAIAGDVLIVPGRATSAVHNGMITYCEITRSGLLFAILDPPANQTAAQMVSYVETTASLLELSEFGAIYWPRVKIANPSRDLFGSDATITIPPSGHVAGVYARNDSRKTGGAFEQPAGVEFGIPRNVLGLEMDEVRKKTKRELVFPKMINPISQEDGTPIFIDGARTLKSTGNWASVGQRRGMIFIEQRLIPGLAFMRHRNIKDRLYREGERTVEVFMLELCRNECFKSTDPAKAFFIDFGSALNPPSVQAQKKVVARLGVATSEPAEFVVVLVGPDTRALDEELAALAA
jgi:hypothetical protein